VTFHGEFFGVENSTLGQRPYRAEDGRHPRLYFGGASPAAEAVSATEADVQLFWGEPLARHRGTDPTAARPQRIAGRVHAPLEFGLPITTLVRETSDEAWRDAEAKVEKMAAAGGEWRGFGKGSRAVGQQRLLELAERGEVLDTCLYTTPGKYGAGGAATTWLVGSYDEVADALGRYRQLGVTHFVLSDTPYKQETVRVGDQLLPRLHTASLNPT
jgi:alkanesulfonate monooxygenase